MHERASWNRWVFIWQPAKYQICKTKEWRAQIISRERAIEKPRRWFIENETYIKIY